MAKVVRALVVDTYLDGPVLDISYTCRSHGVPNGVYEPMGLWVVGLRLQRLLIELVPHLLEQFDHIQHLQR